MSVHCLKDGRWVVKYRLHGTHKQKWEYFGRGLEGEAAARARQEELGIGQYVRRTPARAHTAPTFAEVAQVYHETHGVTLPQASKIALFAKLKSVLLPELGHLAVADLTHYRMDQYVARRLAAGKKRTTIHREVSDVMAMLNWALARRLIIANPLAGYRKPTRDDAVIMPITAAELRRILAESAGHLARALLLSFYTGVRPGRAELLALRWADVDLAAGTIWVQSARKGGPVARVVPIHPDLRGHLDAWRKADMPDKKAGAKKTPASPQFIVHYKGRPVASLKTAWQAAKRRAGITRRLPMYSLRHAFATLLLGDGADLKTTSAFLGHSRPDTTMRVYQHIDADLAQKTIARLPALGPVATTMCCQKPRRKKRAKPKR